VKPPAFLVITLRDALLCALIRDDDRCHFLAAVIASEIEHDERLKLSDGFLDVWSSHS